MCTTGFIFGGTGKAVRNLDAEERPFEIFTSSEQLNEYRQTHPNDFFNLTDEEYDTYNAAFFSENAMVMFLTQGMSGSIKCIAEDTRFDDGKLYVKVKELSPPMHTMDLHYNTLAVSVPRDIAQNITAVYIESYRVDV